MLIFAFKVTGHLFFPLLRNLLQLLTGGVQQHQQSSFLCVSDSCGQVWFQEGLKSCESVLTQISDTGGAFLNACMLCMCVTALGHGATLKLPMVARIFPLTGLQDQTSSCNVIFFTQAAQMTFICCRLDL